MVYLVESLQAAFLWVNDCGVKTVDSGLGGSIDYHREIGPHR